VQEIFYKTVGVSDFHFRGHILLLLITGGENANYLLLKLISQCVATALVLDGKLGPSILFGLWIVVHYQCRI
jgi:hypothetical protein